MAKIAGVFLALGSLLLGANAARADYTQPSLVRAIEQARTTSFAGSTFVQLTSARCAFRGDGFFVLPNDPKQAQQLDMLLAARVNRLRVIVSFTPPSCDVATVGLCPNTGTC